MKPNALVVSPIQWDSLRHIDEVEPLNDTDTDCLHEIYEVLKKHGKADRLGVALLHSHFHLADDEILLETSDDEARMLTLRPVRQTEAGDTVGTIWKLRESDTIVMGHCHRYCERDWLTKGHNKAHRRIHSR